MSKTFDPCKESKTFKRAEDGSVYMETRTTLKSEQVPLARNQGWAIKDTGEGWVATKKFAVNPPVSIEDAIQTAKGGEDEVYGMLLDKFALNCHASNRNEMAKVIDQKVPKENETILGFMAQMGLDTSKLTFEQKCDKVQLATILQNHLAGKGAKAQTATK